MNENRMFQLCLAVVLLATATVALLGWTTRPDIPSPSAVLVDKASQVEEILQSSSLNLNTATAEELEALPGIGQVLSVRIVDYREELGSFTNAEQLLEVPGIGQVTYEKLCPFVYVKAAK